MAEAGVPLSGSAATAAANFPDQQLPSPIMHKPYLSFFRVILPCVLQEQKLKLPLHFVRTHGEELGSTAKLSLQNGCSWEVTVEKGQNDDVWLMKGWSEFVERHSISNGFFLVFDFLGRNEFKVQIFNLTTCSIHYPESDEKKGQQEDEQEQASSAKCSVVVISGDEENGEDSSRGDCEFVESDRSDPELGRSRKRIAKRRRKKSLPNKKAAASSSSGFESETCKHQDSQSGETESDQLLKLVKSRGIYTSAKFPSTLCKMYNQCGKGVKAAAALQLIANPKTPCFIAVMSMRGDSTQRVMTPTIPASFIRNHIRGEWKSVTLVNQEQQRWDVDTEKNTNSAGGLLMGYGWTHFHKDNSLGSADVCLFQLVPDQERLLRVSVFSASSAPSSASSNAAL